MNHNHHMIDYIEFTMTDLEKAKTFYSLAFGWKFNDYGPGYVGIQGEEREVGGFSLGDKVHSGGPLVILHSDDLEASLAAVREAGGLIVKDIFEFPGGRRFQFHDVCGNELAVWSENSK